MRPCEFRLLTHKFSPTSLPLQVLLNSMPQMQWGLQPIRWVGEGVFLCFLLLIIVCIILAGVTFMIPSTRICVSSLTCFRPLELVVLCLFNYLCIQLGKSPWQTFWKSFISQTWASKAEQSVWPLKMLHPDSRIYCYTSKLICKAKVSKAHSSPRLYLSL